MNETLHKFRATTFDEAYRQMVKALGQDAIVVNTAEIVEGGVLGFLGHRTVEVTARPGRVPMPRPLRPRSLPERRYEAAQSQIGSDERVNETVAYFRRLVSDAQMRMGQNPGHAEALPELRIPPNASAMAQPELSVPQNGQAVPRVEERPNNRRVGDRRVGDRRRTSQPKTPVPAPAGRVLPFVARTTEAPPIEDLQREIREMRELLQVVVTDAPRDGLAGDFSKHAANLIEKGVGRKLAASLIAAVVSGSDPTVIRNPRVFEARLKMEMQKRLSITGGVRLKDHGCRVVAIVGATGVGKTTNLAKLAAQFAVEKRKRVALITTDTYRVAAPEQLRVYANIVGLPMRVADDGDALRQAIASFEDYDLVLIDTAGGSQFNRAQIEELEATLAAVHLDEVMLMLAANTQLDGLRTATANFRRLHPSSLFFSKLDETRHFGAMYTMVSEVGLPMSYFSTGQNVPDDIELASAGKLVKLLTENGGSGVGPSA